MLHVASTLATPEVHSSSLNQLPKPTVINSHPHPEPNPSPQCAISTEVCETLRIEATPPATQLASRLLPLLEEAPGDIVVICTAADADSFAAPLLRALDEAGLGQRVKLQCLWNEPVRISEFTLSPASRFYQEPHEETGVTLVLAQTVLTPDAQVPDYWGVTTARTNLTHAWPEPSPDAVFVVSAATETSAFEALVEEFPPGYRERFRLLTLETVPAGFRDGLREGLRSGLRTGLPMAFQPEGQAVQTPAPTSRFADIPAIVRARRDTLKKGRRAG